MASRADVEAGRAFVRLYLKNDMASQLVRSLRAAQMKLRNFGRSAMRAGKGMIMAGAAVSAPLVLGMREFANFDAKMRDVSTMLDKPEDFMPGFRQGIKAMAIEFGKTKDDLGTGLYDILSATVPPEQAMQRLAAATKLAAAGNAEVGASVSTLNTLMDTYGDSFKNAADASDFLFAIVKRGRTNLTELSGDLGKIISTAKAAGMSVEDMGASAALLTRATGQTETALTALNAISAGVLKPQAAGAKLWKEKFGDALNASTIKAIGMMGVLKRLSTLKPAEVTEVFPNMRAIRGIFPAIAKMKGFSEDLGAMANRADNVGTAFEKIKGPLFYWKQMLEQGKNILLEIGNAIAEVIVPFKDKILATGKAVAEFVRNNKRLVVATAAVAAGLVAAGIALTGIGFAAMGASAAFGILAWIISAVASPLGIVTAIVIGGATAWLRYSESGKRAWASLKPTLGEMLVRFREVFGGIAAAIQSGNWGLAFDIINTAAQIALSKIAGRMTYLFRTLIPGLASSAFVGLIGGWQAVAASWREPVVAVWEFFKASSRAAFDFVRYSLRSQVIYWADQFVAVWNLFKAVARPALELIGKLLVSKLKFGNDLIKALWDGFKSNAGKAADGFGVQLGDAMIAAAEAFVRFQVKAASYIAKTIARALTGRSLSDYAKAAMDARLNAAAQAERRALQGRGDQDEPETGFEAGIMGAMKADAARTAEAMRQAAQDVTPAIKLFFEEIITATAEHAERMKAAGIDAARVIGPAAARLAEVTKGMSEEVRAAFAERFQAAFAGVEDYKDPAAVTALRQKLSKLIAEATAKRPVGISAAGAVAGGPSGAGGAGGGGLPLGGTVRSTAPLGVGLTATYSAAAARIAGYQPGGGGPEKKMADGIVAIERNTKEMAIQQQQFLAGWRVA